MKDVKKLSYFLACMQVICLEPDQDKKLLESILKPESLEAMLHTVADTRGIDYKQVSKFYEWLNVEMFEVPEDKMKVNHLAIEIMMVSYHLKELKRIGFVDVSNECITEKGISVIRPLIQGKAIMTINQIISVLLHMKVRDILYMATLVYEVQYSGADSMANSN